MFTPFTPRAGLISNPSSRELTPAPDTPEPIPVPATCQQPMTTSHMRGPEAAWPAARDVQQSGGQRNYQHRAQVPFSDSTAKVALPSLEQLISGAPALPPVLSVGTEEGLPPRHSREASPNAVVFPSLNSVVSHALFAPSRPVDGTASGPRRGGPLTDVQSLALSAPAFGAPRPLSQIAPGLVGAGALTPPPYPILGNDDEVLRIFHTYSESRSTALEKLADHMKCTSYGEFGLQDVAWWGSQSLHHPAVVWWRQNSYGMKRDVAGVSALGRLALKERRQLPVAEQCRRGLNGVLMHRARGMGLSKREWAALSRLNQDLARGIALSGRQDQQDAAHYAFQSVLAETTPRPVEDVFADWNVQRPYSQETVDAFNRFRALLTSPTVRPGVNSELLRMAVIAGLPAHHANCLGKSFARNGKRLQTVLVLSASGAHMTAGVMGEGDNLNEALLAFINLFPWACQGVAPGERGDAHRMAGAPLPGA